MKRFTFALLAICFLASCASHYGSIGSSSNLRNVKYEDIACGVTQTSTLFGIGGLSQDAMVMEAKRNLYQNRPLKAKEEYANFTLDFKNTYFPFYSQTKLTVSADVIKFMDDSVSEPYSDNYKKKIANKTLSTNLFAIGDSIFDKQKKEATIISVENEDHVRILYKTKKNKYKTRRVSINNIYSTRKTYNDLKIGARFVFDKELASFDTEKSSGRILAFGVKEIMLYSRQSIIFVPYK